MAAVKCARAALRAARSVVVLLIGLSGAARVVHAQPPPEAIEYYATDAVGSVRIVFTPTGQVLGRSDYLPFGESLNQSGTLPRQRFTGQERDGEAGMDYFNARNLQARTGRMNAPDPLFGDALLNPQDWNRYAYVRNNPLRLTDPTGAESQATFKVTIFGYTPYDHPCFSMPDGGCVGGTPDTMSDGAREGSADLLAGAQWSSWYEGLAGSNFFPFFGARSTTQNGNTGSGQTPPLPPPPNLPKGDPAKPVDPGEVKKKVAGPGCEMVEMQVTGYTDGNPRTADNTPTAEGVMAVALFKPQPYPFGARAEVLGTQGNALYVGVVHDLGLGWDSNHHKIRPEQFLDVYKSSYQSASSVGNWWRLVRVCRPQ